MPAQRNTQGQYLVPPFREQRGDRTDVWHVTPPDEGVRFTVIASEWRSDMERHIFAWAEAEPDPGSHDPAASLGRCHRHRQQRLGRAAGGMRD